MTDEGSVAFACLLGVKRVGVSGALFSVVRRYCGQELEHSKTLFQSWHAELVLSVDSIAVRAMSGWGPSVPPSRRLHGKNEFGKSKRCQRF